GRLRRMRRGLHGGSRTVPRGSRQCRGLRSRSTSGAALVKLFLALRVVLVVYRQNGAKLVLGGIVALRGLDTDQDWERASLEDGEAVGEHALSARGRAFVLGRKTLRGVEDQADIAPGDTARDAVAFLIDLAAHEGHVFPKLSTAI